MLYVTRNLSLVCFGLMSLFSNVLYASFPKGCEVTGFGYHDQYLILNQDAQQTFFLIQNHVNQTVQLQRHETHDVFMSPKLETNLAASNWAAFASDEQNMYFQCAFKQGANYVPVHCSEVLDVCRYPRARFALSNRGNYWVSTNKSQDLVIKEAVAKGIYLKW